MGAELHLRVCLRVVSSTAAISKWKFKWLHRFSGTWLRTHATSAAHLVFYHSLHTQLLFRPSCSNFSFCIPFLSRSQWPRGVKHELSSFARNFGSWFRIPLNAWMSILYAFILCVGREALRRSDHPSKECYWLFKRSRNWKSSQGPTKGRRAIIIIIIIKIIIIIPFLNRHNLCLSPFLLLFCFPSTQSMYWYAIR
jgi:hypothetical protein